MYALLVYLFGVCVYDCSPMRGAIRAFTVFAGNYGSSLNEVFKNIAQEAGICIAQTEQVFNNAEDEAYDTVLKNLLMYKSTARAVACFCEGMTVRNLLKATRRLEVAGDLLLIGR